MGTILHGKNKVFQSNRSDSFIYFRWNLKAYGGIIEVNKRV
jgi:hypothetical protein